MFFLGLVKLYGNFMKALLIVICLILSSQCYADKGYYLLGGIGIGEIDIKPAFQVNNTNINNDNFDYHGFVGYRFDNNIQLELGYANHGALDLDILDIGDNSKVSEYLFLAGYRFEISEKVMVIPRAGYSRWEHESKEGIFLNPGSEIQISQHGNNQIYMLSVFEDIFYMTYQSTDYDFGSLTSLIIGVEIGL